jgi:WD40 repeat protein
VYAPSIVIATLNDGSILDHSNLVQDLTTYYTDKFTLLRQYLQVRSMQYSWLDTLHPYHLMAYLNHYTNLLPSAILLLVWIGIMLWMNTFVREQYMLPIMRVVFVRIVTLVLRIITRITFIQTDSLIRKVETEYNEDGMHLGAISLQSQFHLQQTRERVPNVSIRTLMGQHAADIKAMACHGAVETTRKLISTDQEGKLVLWNITAETETAIARLDLQRQLGGGLNGWVGTKQQQQGLNPIEMRQLPAARCVQMDSQGKLVIAGYDHGYISVWNAETAHVVRELSVQDPSGEYRNHRVLHLSFLEPNNGTKKKKSSSKYIFSVHKNGYLREWNIKTGEMIEAFDSNHKRDITVITILADNQHQHKLWVFTASKDGIVKCWERTLTAGHDMHPTTNWRCMYSIQAHHGHMITSLAAHQLHNGLGILVTGSNGGGVCVWQLANGKPLCTLSKDSNSSKTAAAGNQNDGLLLQFSKVEQQQGLQQQTQPQCLLAQADHGRSVSQVVITRLGCPEFDNDMCSHCQTTLNTGFLVASSALDDSVHCWRLDRMLSHENGCTQCIKEYRHRPYHSMAPVPPTAGPPRASQRKKHSNNNRDQSGDESEDEETQQPLSLSVSFLGKLDQADGRGLVFCDNMVLAGVRRRQTYLDTEDDGDDVGLWEAWFVSLQYYEPPPIKEEDAFAIPVITFDLEKDEDYYREIEEKELIDVQEMAKTNSLWDQILLSLFGIKKVRAAPWPTEASIAATRKRSYPSESLGNTSGYEEDDDAYEILPFSTIRLVMPMNGYGFCCDYGNFIKCISFENRHDVPSSTTSTSSR